MNAQVAYLTEKRIAPFRVWVQERHGRALRDAREQGDRNTNLAVY